MKKEILAKLNINCLEDLLTFYPVRYIQNTITNLDEKLDKILVEAVVASVPITRYYRRKSRTSFNCLVDKKLVKVAIFNRTFLKEKLVINEVITIEGKYNLLNNTITSSNIIVGKLNTLKPITSVYKKTKGITDNNINSHITKNLNKEIDDYIPSYYSEKYNFVTKNKALEYIHNPSDIKQIKQAKLRLKYEELFMFMFKINCLKYNNSKVLGITKKIDYSKVVDFINSLTFELTKDQLVSIDDIYSDLITNRRMNRMIQGDVGSGKTIVAIVAIYMNFLAGYQSAFMSPTEILANQHYTNLIKLFSNYGLKVCILTSSVKEKNKLYKLIKDGYYDVVVGTHSLINNELEYNKLGLVITDEQQRFGVNQRYLLKEKSSNCDCLYLSATPIPRSYALILYKDMSLSLIKTKPLKRAEVITKVINEDNIKDALELIYEELKLSHQVYVVAKSINDTNSEESVESLKEKFNKAYSNKYKIDILHGKMKQIEKDMIMARFKNKEIDILISTTVIEVGIDVSNASVMVIFNAEYFGLSQLHQLRGRVGRSSITSYCLLITNKTSNERLKILESTTDGFKISEEDYKLRGVGDLFGQKQSGESSFKIVNLKTDDKILKQANIDSYEYLEKVIVNIDKYPLYKDIIYSSINLD